MTPGVYFLNHPRGSSMGEVDGRTRWKETLRDTLWNVTDSVRSLIN